MRQNTRKSSPVLFSISAGLYATSFLFSQPPIPKNSYYPTFFMAASPFEDPSPAYPTNFFATPTLTPIPTSTPTPTPIPLSPQPKNRPSPDDLAPLFEQWGRAYGADPQLLQRIAYCESHFNPGAVNGPYGGMFQFHPQTWKSERGKWGWDSDSSLRFDANESIKTAAAKIGSGGIGAWPVCGRL